MAFAVDKGLAARITGTGRTFSSVEDIDLALDLPVATLARLRDVAVCVPPGPGAPRAPEPPPRIQRGVRRGTVRGWVDDRWWNVLLPLGSIGMLTWAGFAYAGARARSRGLFVSSAVYGIASGAGLVLTNNYPHGAPANTLGASLVLGSMVVGTLHGVLAVPHYKLRCHALERLDLEADVRRQSATRLARHLLEDEPDTARRLGVGRPDLAGAFGAGLVDLNSAPAAVIANGCGVDAQTAERIVRTREDLGTPFSSLEDMDLVLDLPVPVLDRLRETAVFVR